MGPPPDLYKGFHGDDASLTINTGKFLAFAWIQYRIRLLERTRLCPLIGIILCGVGGVEDKWKWKIFGALLNELARLENSYGDATSERC